MDPLTCLSVAGTVVQFVDFASKLISKGHELYKAGELSVYEKVALATNDLLDLNTKLQKPLYSDGALHCVTKDEADLQDLCNASSELAKELLERLGRLKITDKYNVTRSLRKAFRSVWEGKELGELEDRLERLRSAIDTRILASLRRDLSNVALEQSQLFDALDHQTQQIIGAFVDLDASLTKNLHQQTLALSQILDRRSIVVLSDEEQVRRDQAMDALSTSSIPADVLRGQFSIFRDPAEEEAKLRHSVGRDLLKSLWFQTITDRYEEIAEAHKRTFEWIFQDSPYEEARWSNFAHWLSQGDGLYWIQGKAGSGKSTLMKYICNNLETKSYLEEWAGDLPCYTAEFFLWNSGLKLQRSQSGLLRSILWEILRQVPLLIPVLLPQQWATLYSSQSRQMEDQKLPSWSLSELLIAFQTLLTQTTIQMRLCIFIDGLDEYDGLDADMAKLFSKAASSLGVKVCASSRPHIVFQDAFVKNPGLRLQDLTFPDIQRYINDRLVKDSQMQELWVKEPIETPKLVQEIINMASGVFLWVELVVTSLLMGLGNHDQISDLQRRLRLLPRDLEQLYKQMVLKFYEVYRDEASQLFRIVEASNFRDDDALGQYYEREEPWQLSIFTLALTQEGEEALLEDRKHAPLDPEEIVRRCTSMDDRLKSRCGGLIETNLFGAKSIISPHAKVRYYHRTVRDFIRKPETRQLLIDQTATDDFNPSYLLHRAYALQLSFLPSQLLEVEHVSNFIDAGLIYARQADLDQRPLFLEEIIAKSKVFWQYSKGATQLLEDEPLQLAVRDGLQNYVQARLSSDAMAAIQVSSPNDKGLLYYALVPGKRPREFPSLAIISTLLQLGANPNYWYRSSTPWISMLQYIHLHNHEFRSIEQQLRRWEGAIRLLLQHGADVTVEYLAPAPTSLDSWNLETVIAETFQIFPMMREGLQEEIALRRSNNRNWLGTTQVKKLARAGWNLNWTSLFQR